MIPADAELTARHEEITAWDDMPAELKPVLERQMEVYAGFLEHTDHQVGRLVDTIEDLGCPRRHDHLLHHRRRRRLGRGHHRTAPSTRWPTSTAWPPWRRRSSWLSKMDEFGSPSSIQPLLRRMGMGHELPFQWTKQVASHWGGTRNGTIVHWPVGIEESRAGCARSSRRVIDVAPTILEAAGLPEPAIVNGVTQAPIEGISMLYSFNDGSRRWRHDLQYFEMFGNRGVYHKGWSAVTQAQDRRG